MHLPWPSRSIGILFALLASFLWGGTGVWIYFLQAVPFVQLTWYRFILSLAFTGFLLLAARKKPVVSMPIMLGGFMLFSYYTLATMAFALANMVEVALIVSSTPVFVVVIDYLRGRRPALIQLLGLLLASVGTLFVIVDFFSIKVQPQADYPFAGIGQACALGAALSMATFSVVCSSDRTDTASVNLYAFAFGSLLLTSFTFTEKQNANPLTLNQFELLVGLVILSTVLASFCYKYACQFATASIAATVRLSTPFFASIFSYLFLSQRMSMVDIVGAGIILGGVYMSLAQRRYPR